MHPSGLSTIWVPAHLYPTLQVCTSFFPKTQRTRNALCWVLPCLLSSSQVGDHVLVLHMLFWCLLGADSDLFLHLVPSLWVIGTYSQAFVSWARCPEKLHIEVLGSKWSANLSALNPWQSCSPAVYSFWACTPDIPIHTPFIPISMFLLKFCAFS